MTDLNHKDTVLFDLDGTLTDSAPGILNSLRYALEKQGEPIPEETTLRRFIGPPLYDGLVNFLGFTSERAVQTVAFYREYYAEKGALENRVYPGIVQLLAQLRQEGMRLCVATSKPTVYTERILEHFGLSEYFDAVGGSLLDGSRDRKSDVIRYLIESYGVEPEKAVMVGDRFYDVEGAAEHGIATVGVLFGYGSEEELNRAGAWKLARDTQELYRILMEAAK